MFGCHIHKGNYKNYEEALQYYYEEMKKCGVQMKSCQVFVMGPQNVHENFNDESAKQFGEFAGNLDVKIVVHNSYLVSLWNNDTSRRPFARMNIQKQLALCDKMKAAGFVIHIPNESVADIVAELANINLKNFETPIYLETKASNPAKSKNYELPKNLDALFSAVAGRDFGDRVGHCVDTAHLWSSGLSTSSRSEAVQYFSELSRIAGGHLWNKIHGGNNGLIIHLNDAVNAFANGKDEHALLGKGLIWGQDKGGIKAIIEFIHTSGIIAILERNKGEGLENDCSVIAEYTKQINI